MQQSDHPGPRVDAGMTLADVEDGRPVSVRDVRCPVAAEGWHQQLVDLGFTRGERAVVLRRGWPGGDPLAVRIGSSTFALRRAEARCVHVEPLA